MSYLSKWINNKKTPQSAPIPGRNQVPNSGGGFAFAVDDWTRLDRFLVLGCEGGSYYASERALTLDNAQAVLRCLEQDGPRAVERILAVSEQGRAPRNDPALFALALAAKRGDLPTRRAAFAALPRVARIGTHLFHFAEYVKALGGWGRGTMRAFARWYTEMEASRLALQAVKYQSRDGWSHRDLLRKAHPVARDDRQQALFHWMTQGWQSVGEAPHPDQVLATIWAFERSKSLREPADIPLLVELVRQYGLPHECVPTEMKRYPQVWEALLPEMGLTALLRNLGKMTQVGLLGAFSAAERLVVSRLEDSRGLRAARVHPLQILVALTTYAQGHGDKGKLTWQPRRKIADALDAAFYRAFQSVEPTNARTLLALDVSGSMGCGLIAGMAGITPRVGSAAMALLTAATEPQHELVAFTEGKGRSMHHGVGCGISPLAISPRSRLDKVVAAISDLPFGGTDCALPMIWAAEQRMPVDLFCIYTDSETWAGDIHPVQALEAYRQKMGIGARLVVVGMVSNGFSIAEPKDGGMLDVVGFDTAAPAVIADFARAALGD
ncbi:MAG TPA: TROVE domain-containing protein [Polyangia bacterium]|nr:TROVE domain-containing protein [Polyangia bacterium]